MLDMLRKRQENEEGFTLIELMVVVLIIAILLAIAIPTFLGARERAQDRAAQSNLRNALTAEKVFYTDNQAYTTSTAAMDLIEPSLVYAGDAVPSVVGTVYIDTATSASAVTDDTVTVATKSASGKCFFLRDIAAGAGAGTFYAAETTCATAPSAKAVADPKW